MHPAIAQQQEQAYKSLHDEYHKRAHGRDRMKEVREMPQQMVISHEPYAPKAPTILLVQVETRIEWNDELECYYKIGPLGLPIYGNTKEEVCAKSVDAARLYNTNCPSCGWHTSERVCPECGQDREWYASETGGMWGEHIQRGQA